METANFILKNNDRLVLREARQEDAERMLSYVKKISHESKNLTFTSDEFTLTAEKQKEIFENCKDSDNDLYLLGFIDGEIVSSINFVGGKRSRINHSGEFGMAVKKDKWNLGIGGLMLDVLVDWSKNTKIIRKINLRVREDNEPAIHLYEKKGFIVEGKISRGFQVDGEFIDHVCMGLSI